MNCEIYVSPTGKDGAAGTKEAPLRTLACAVERLTSGSRIVLRGGTYELHETVRLTDVSDVVIEAYPQERVILTGAHRVRYEDFSPVRDDTMRSLLPEAALELDLKKFGRPALTEPETRGFRRPYIPAPAELVIDGKAMRFSRYPKDCEYPVTEVPDPGSVSMDVAEPDFSNRGGTIRYDDERISSWKHTQGILSSGFFSYGYADDTIPVKSIDAKEHTFTLRDAVMFGVLKSNETRYHFLNVPEEPCLPEEYCIDAAAQKLYLIPPAGFDKDSTIYLTENVKPLLSLRNTARVTVRNLTLCASRGIGIYMERGEDNVLEHLQIQHMGIVGVVIGKGITPDRGYRHHFYRGEPISEELGSLNEHIYNDILYNRDAGTGHSVKNCEISHCGAGGISMGGGDRKTLTPAGNRIENCKVYNCNRLDKSLKALIDLDGVGNVIRGCELFQATNMAILLHGNDHVIEYNNIHHACTDTQDAGAIYLGRDPSEQGNIIRYNYIHDILSAHRPNVPLRDGLGSFAVYNDDNACGTVIFGNVFYRAGNWAIHNNCSSDIQIRNNIFVECQTAVVHGDRFWGCFATDPMTRPGGLFYDRLLRQARIFDPPYCERYPNLTKFFDNDGKPLRNVFSDNILYRCLNALATRHKDEWYINDYYLTDETHSYQDVISQYRGWYRQQGNLVLDEDAQLDGHAFDLRTFQREDILKCVPAFQRIPIEKIAGVK